MMNERHDNPAEANGKAGQDCILPLACVRDRFVRVAAARRCALRLRSAFTIVELLMVVGIVIIILGIIVVALNAAMRTAQSTNTQALMTSINKGLVQFQSDIGYLPPVLDNDRNYSEPPTPPENEDADPAFGQYFDNVQDWWSITTLSEYLLGYGDATEDGYGRVVDPTPFPGVDFSMNENDGPLGIRHPGPDGYWGVSPASNGGGTLDARREEMLGTARGQRFRQGRSYGPYIELRDERLLAAVLGQNPDGTFITAFAGEANYDPTRPKAIVDYWGQPIRYFRKPYVPGMPNQDYRRGMYNRDGVELKRAPTLSDVIVLRPWRVRPGEEIDVHQDAADAAGDTTTSRPLHAATFALLSSGPDRRLRTDKRVDANVGDGDQEYNRDNIVELGR